MYVPFKIYVTRLKLTHYFCLKMVVMGTPVN